MDEDEVPTIRGGGKFPLDLLDVQLPKGYLSASSIGTYLRCPKQFEFRYVKGVISPPGVALVEGSSYHVVMEHNNRCRKSGRSIPDRDEMEGMFEEVFLKKAEEIEDWGGEDTDDVLERSGRILDKTEAMTAAVIGEEPVEEVEQEIIGVFGGVPILGYIDLSLPSRLFDYKFANKSVSESDLLHHLQLGIYSAMTGKSYVGILRAERGKKFNVQSVQGSIGKPQRRIAEETVRGVRTAIVSGAFPPCSPDGWHCSEKWCGYWNRCRGRKS